MSDTLTIFDNRQKLTEQSSFLHPIYEEKFRDWVKFRLVFEGGRKFINEYLKKYSKRESDADFDTRKSATYSPSHSKAALKDILNAIYQRISDVTRKDGTDSYQSSVLTDVDQKGSSMNSFIGRQILPELLSIGRVGTFVDMPKINGITLSEQLGNKPYLYVYQAEDILNWSIDYEGGKRIYKNLLLRDYHEKVDPKTGMVTDVSPRFRHMWINDQGTVNVQFFNEKYESISETKTLNINQIPFILFEIQHSLLEDIADYQIALLNMESADINYLIRSNFPFYVEKYDPKTEIAFQRLRENTVITGADGTTKINPGEASHAALSRANTVELGNASGKRIPQGVDYPEFRHPSSEPVKASMDKQEQIKRDIRHLINLAITNLQPKMASAESKNVDNQGLENGLSAIGLELEYGERLIADYWSMWEGSKKSATVKYPKRYSLQSESERRNEAESLLNKVDIIPSLTYKKWALKKAIDIQIGPDVSDNILEQIFKEIDDAEVIYSDVDHLAKDIEQGIIGLEDASKAKGYPEGTVERAKEDHLERIKRIAESQSQARGVPDLGGLENASRDEKNNNDTNDTVSSDNTRGEGK